MQCMLWWLHVMHDIRFVYCMYTNLWDVYFEECPLDEDFHMIKEDDLPEFAYKKCVKNFDCVLVHSWIMQAYGRHRLILENYFWKGCKSCGLWCIQNLTALTTKMLPVPLSISWKLELGTRLFLIEPCILYHATYNPYMYVGCVNN